MCTLTYLLQDDGYQLWFNRDEQRSRLPAEPPKFVEQANAIMAIDTQAGGTWLAQHQPGISFALLNYYQGTTPHNTKLHSRGHIIPYLCQYADNWLAIFNQLNFNQYAPFTLVVLPAQLTKKTPTVNCYCWTGNELITQPIAGFITSSGKAFSQVKQYRQQLFHERVEVAHTPKPELHQQFHYHQATDGKLGVLMQREDACTVSIAKLTVNSSVKHFNYHDLLQDNVYQVAIAQAIPQ